MASKEITKAPLDELTGLPLPIFYGPHHLGLEKNFQHGWHSLNKLRETLDESWAQALRISRGYVIPVQYHMPEMPYGYHNAIDEGPDPPQDIDGVFAALALGVSRVVPRMSIDLTQQPGVYSPKELTNRQHRFLSNPRRTAYEKEFCPEEDYRTKKKDVIGRFITEYTLRKMAESRGASPIEEEVLLDQCQPLTLELGAISYRSFIESLNTLIAPVDSIFRQARGEGMVANRKTDVRNVILGFVPQHQFGTYYIAAREKILKKTVAPLQTGVDEVKLKAA